MIQEVLFIGFQGWINTVFGSVWTYLFLGLFFVFLLVVTLLYSRSCKASKARPPQSAPLNSCNGSGDCESKLIHSLQALPGSSKTVLLAAAGLECLPVTVPIRIAMLSSENKQRCLLIDLDTRRDAVWKAFGLNGQSNPAAFPAPTGIPNLSIVPAHYFERNKQMNIVSITRDARKQYDLILINAPYLDGHPDRKMITSSANYAFVFAKEMTQADRLQKLCDAGRCKVLGCYKTQKNGSAAAPASAQ